MEFFQSSNDLVKNAILERDGTETNLSSVSKLLQSKKNAPYIAAFLPEHSTMSSNISTIQRPVSQIIDDSSMYSLHHYPHTLSTEDGASRFVSSQELNYINGKQTINRNGFSIIEGFNGDASSNRFLEDVSNEVSTKNNVIDKIDEFMKLESSTTVNENKGKWTKVTDPSGVSKYGYISNAGVFEVWFMPNDVRNQPSNWLASDPTAKNTGVLGCPSSTSGMRELTIQKRWIDVKPYEIIYNNATPPTPLFYMINTQVRDVKTSLKEDGLYSCGNEGRNVWASSRPAADIELNTGAEFKTGCFKFKSGKGWNDLPNVGYQTDLGYSTIAACKRRTEDLGKTQFMMSYKNGDTNTGLCFVNTGATPLNLNNVFEVSADECGRLSNQQNDEDNFMKKYTHDQLPRQIGKFQWENKEDIDMSNRPTPPCPSGWWQYGGVCYQGCALNAQGRHDDGRCICDSGGANTNCAAGHRCINKKCRRVDTTWTYKQGFSLYTLKGDGPSGVDKNGGDFIGKVAYITRNGQRRDYPSSLYQMGNEYTKISNYTSNSNDLGYVGSNRIKTLDQCKRDCNSNEQCGGFTFRETGNGNGECTLKNKNTYPQAQRQPLVNTDLYIRKPVLTENVDTTCRNPNISEIDTLSYQYYSLNPEKMTADDKCSLYGEVSKMVDTRAPSLSGEWFTYFKSKIENLQKKVGSSMTEFESYNKKADEYNKKYVDICNNIADMNKTRSTTDALMSESKLVLMNETYRYILWAILAIVIVIGIIKLKEKFIDGDGSASGESSSSIKSSDIGLGLGGIGAAMGLSSSENDENKSGDERSRSRLDTTLQSERGENGDIEDERRRDRETDNLD